MTSWNIFIKNDKNELSGLYLYKKGNSLDLYVNNTLYEKINNSIYDHHQDYFKIYKKTFNETEAYQISKLFLESPILNEHSDNFLSYLDKNDSHQKITINERGFSYRDQHDSYYTQEKDLLKNDTLLSFAFKFIDEIRGEITDIEFERIFNHPMYLINESTREKEDFLGYKQTLYFKQTINDIRVDHPYGYLIISINRNGTIISYLDRTLKFESIHYIDDPIISIYTAIDGLVNGEGYIISSDQYILNDFFLVYSKSKHITPTVYKPHYLFHLQPLGDKSIWEVYIDCNDESLIFGNNILF